MNTKKRKMLFVLAIYWIFCLFVGYKIFSEPRYSEERWMETPIGLMYYPAGYSNDVTGGLMIMGASSIITLVFIYLVGTDKVKTEAQT